MASGGSRFKVVPVETRDPYFSPGKHAVPKPAAAIKKEEVVNRTNRSLSDIHPSSSPSVVQPSAIPVQQKSTSNIIAPNPKPVYTVPKVAPTAQVKASTTIQPTANGQVKVSSETQVSSGADETRRTKRYLSLSGSRDVFFLLTQPLSWFSLSNH
uniref:ZM domain-containing protein n=1 Tax=Caenorhabditis tropicalis TaxID=1561998 RepID=A0A1I7U037_9PELO